VTNADNGAAASGRNDVSQLQTCLTDDETTQSC